MQIAFLLQPENLFSSQYLQLHSTTDVTGTISTFTADDGSAAEMVMPGDRIKMTVQLINPIAVEQGMRFAIREGGRTIGAGAVSKIVK